MSEERRFSKESLIYVFGEALSKSLGFILLPIYASYLSIDDFAVLNLVLILWPIVVVFLGQGFSTFIVREYFEHEDEKAFFGTILLFSLAVGILIAYGIHLAGPFLLGFIFKNVTYKPYLQYGVFFALFRLFFSHVVSIYRAKRQAKTAVLLSLTLFACNMFAVLIAIYVLDAKLLGILRAQLVSYAAVAVIYVAVVRSEVSLRLDSSVLWPAVLFVLPLVPYSISGWLVNYVSQVFVERSLTFDELSIYQMAMRLAMILAVINGGLNQAWVPFVYSNFKEEGKGRLLSISAKRIILLTLFVTLALLLFSKEILSLMGKSEYLKSINLLPLLVLPYIFQIVYFIHVAIIIYYKRTNLLPVISIVSGVVAVILNLILTPRFGVYGAAGCTAAAFLLMALLAVLFSGKYFKLQLLDVRLIGFTLLIAVLIASLFLYVNDLNLATRMAIKLLMAIGTIALLVRSGLLNLRNLREMLRGATV